LHSKFDGATAAYSYRIDAKRMLSLDRLDTFRYGKTNGDLGTVADIGVEVVAKVLEPRIVEPNRLLADQRQLQSRVQVDIESAEMAGVPSLPVFGTPLAHEYLAIPVDALQLLG